MADCNDYCKIQIFKLPAAEYKDLRDLFSFQQKYPQTLPNVGAWALHEYTGKYEVLAITELMCFWVSLTRFTSGRSGIGVPFPILSLYLIYKGTDIRKKVKGFTLKHSWHMYVWQVTWIKKCKSFTLYKLIQISGIKCIPIEGNNQGTSY